MSHVVNMVHEILESNKIYLFIRQNTNHSLTGSNNIKIFAALAQSSPKGDIKSGCLQGLSEIKKKEK